MAVFVGEGNVAMRWYAWCGNVCARQVDCNTDCHGGTANAEWLSKSREPSVQGNKDEVKCLF